MKNLNHLTRQQFLQTAGAAATALAASAGAPFIIPSSARGANAPSNRINVAMIGTGNQGTLDMKGFLAESDAQVVAVCDINRASYGYKTEDQFLGREPARKLVEEHYAEQKRSGAFRGCDAYTDFREVLARPDVDAVAIVVPDHWHALMTVRAAQAGKDIYCEKPLGLTVADGRAMIEAVRRHAVVFQTGSHERSRYQTRFVCELVRNGRIGQLKRIQAVVGPWNKFGPAAGWAPNPVPDGFDYETWLGPAPWAPYHKDRCLYNFRFILDYSDGQVTNYGAHSLDMAQWGNGADRSGPVEFEDLGSEWPADGLFTVAKTVHFRTRYANGVELECITRNDNVSCRFEGTEGFVETGYGGYFAQPESLKKSIIGPSEIHLGSSVNHIRNFLDCVKTREDPIAPVEIGHSSAAVCHVANIAMRLKRKLQWDPKTERFVGDDEANRLLSRAYREPWTL
ncbi:MAG: Gfo/Idh/MocA family oxidoreductase [Candidatus Sumerlaeota bacterium]|nr:Gfo/Idh/MocA family oxidoreductase [Candidatus Sumerlaeota bacterium]